VFSRTATVGKATVMGCEMATSQDFANYVCGSRVHCHYLMHLFRFMAPEWKRLMAGSTHNSIYMPVFQSLQVLLPPVPEQEMIAKALSDADTLIESVVQLLEKKHSLKRGAMQELLAGRTRLPGFGVARGFNQTEVGRAPSDWKVMNLGAICQTSSGTTPSRALKERYYDQGSIAWVKTLDLNNSDVFTTEEKVTEAAFMETSLKVYPIGTVLVAMYGGFNQIGRTGLLKRPAAVNQAITAIRPNATELISGYLIRNLNYRVKYWKSVASSSRKDPNITSKDVKDFPIACPTLAEQEAIVEVLTDIDADIAALEVKLAKFRQVKHGMVQQLLTGRTRLV
jgi:type I restriction enzyme S subunit